MVRQGSYAKGIAKREEILTTALDVIARNGYRKTTIRELAAAVGLSQTGLLHHFGTKEELFAEILRERDLMDTAGFSQNPPPTPEAFIAAMTDLIKHNASVPGLVRLYAQFSSEATELNHPARAFFQEHYANFRSDVAGFIRSQQDLGALPDSLDAEQIATLLSAAADGLQTQWMLDDSIDMAAHIKHLWERLTSA